MYIYYFLARSASLKNCIPKPLRPSVFQLYYSVSNNFRPELLEPSAREVLQLSDSCQETRANERGRGRREHGSYLAMLETVSKRCWPLTSLADGVDTLFWSPIARTVKKCVMKRKENLDNNSKNWHFIIPLWSSTLVTRAGTATQSRRKPREELEIINR